MFKFAWLSRKEEDVSQEQIAEKLKDKMIAYELSRLSKSKRRKSKESVIPPASFITNHNYGIVVEETPASESLDFDASYSYLLELRRAKKSAENAFSRQDSVFKRETK